MKIVENNILLTPPSERKYMHEIYERIMKELPLKFAIFLLTESTKEHHEIKETSITLSTNYYDYKLKTHITLKPIPISPSKESIAPSLKDLPRIKLEISNNKQAKTY